MVWKIGWFGSVYLGKDARYAWQSFCIPDARMNSGTPSIVRIEGADNVMSRRGDSVRRRVSIERTKLVTPSILTAFAFGKLTCSLDPYSNAHCEIEPDPKSPMNEPHS